MRFFGERVTGWRRVAGAMWHAPDDPQIFGGLDIDATALLAFIDQERASGHRITATHLVGRALAHALVKVPDLNVRISHGRSIPRESVAIFFITAVEQGRDLSGIKIANVDRMRAVDVGEELARRSSALKSGRDSEFSRSKRLMDALPPSLLRRALRWTAFLTEELGLDLPALGLHRSPFGSAMVTSVGMFGIPQGFAPLAWMYTFRCWSWSARSRTSRPSSTARSRSVACSRSRRPSTTAMPTAGTSAGPWPRFASTSRRRSASSRQRSAHELRGGGEQTAARSARGSSVH